MPARSTGMKSAAVVTTSCIPARLRAAVAEHGSVLVRGLGLGLRDAAGTRAVFGRLADTLMHEMEAFAPRQALAAGVYSATPWPPQQQMRMHHELSYRLGVPGYAVPAPAAERQAPRADLPVGVPGPAAVPLPVPRRQRRRHRAGRRG